MAKATRDALIASFLRLIDERPLNRITVRDIAEDCGVNRNTFYYHFADVPTLIEELMLEEAGRAVDACAEGETLEDCVDKAVSFMRLHRRAALHLYDSVSRSVLERYLMDACRYAVTAYLNVAHKGAPMREGDREIIVKAYACEFYGLFIDWLNSALRDDWRLELKRLLELRRGMLDEMIRRSGEGIEAAPRQDG